MIKKRQETKPEASAALPGAPEPGQLVDVRRRQWVVQDVAASGISQSVVGIREAQPSYVLPRTPAAHQRQHLVTMTSIDEDALGEELQVIWEIEPGARTLEKAGLPKVGDFDDPTRVDAFLDAIKDALKGQHNIEVRGFGTFKIRKRKTRMARNPRTGEPVEVAARPVPVFKPSKELRALVAEEDAPPEPHA